MLDPQPDRTGHLPLTFDRRALLLGAGAGALVLLTGCGGGDDGDAQPTGGDEGRTAGSLVAFFDGASSLVAGRQARAVFGLGDESGSLLAEVPDSLAFQVEGADGAAVGRPLEVAAHAEGLPRAYFPVTFTPPQPGVYTVTTVYEGEAISASFQVSSEADVQVPGAGDPFPRFDSPTTADARGVDPICTLEPPCPLHDRNLREVVGQRPVAVLVSTPAFCQTAICGPVLDLFLAARAGAPDVSFVHLEVYRSADQVRENPNTADRAPALDALGLTWEPALFLVAADGTVHQRLDVIFDVAELDEALADLQA